MGHKVVSVYDKIVLELDRAGRRVDLPRRELAHMLIEALGITRGETIRKHLNLMVELGYIQPTNAYATAYDLVGAKVHEARQRIGSGKEGVSGTKLDTQADTSTT